MASKFLPLISSITLEEAIKENDKERLYDLLTQPLHKELYARQSFDFLEELSDIQQLLLIYDYVQMQVRQGGFIQLFENGYAGLLPEQHRLLLVFGLPQMAAIVDDALKLYVQHKHIFDQEKSAEDFAKLYNELPGFNSLDKKFDENKAVEDVVLQYAVNHLDEVARVV